LINIYKYSEYQFKSHLMSDFCILYEVIKVINKLKKIKNKLNHGN